MGPRSIWSAWRCRGSCSGRRAATTWTGTSKGSEVGSSSLPTRELGVPAWRRHRGWDSIPGARGCSPEACSFRDLSEEFAAHDTTIYGLSTQGTQYQREAASRLRLPYGLLSDHQHRLTRALRLPTFDVVGMTLLRRVTLLLVQGRMKSVLYPVFPLTRRHRKRLPWSGHWAGLQQRTPCVVNEQLGSERRTSARVRCDGVDTSFGTFLPPPATVGWVTRESWTSTTHDWTASVDVEHLEEVRRNARQVAPTGALHLVFEVLAYAVDEADSNGGGRATVTVRPDGSVRVADDGRGTDTRRTDDGLVVRKPVMATRDLRFFDDPGAQCLPDGHPRRGISVVAALSDWLLHENRRLDGAWQQRYARGIPTSDLVLLPADGSTGTVVTFKPGAAVQALPPDIGQLVAVASTRWLRVDVMDERA
jgi:topoisomerase-4 subunit B